MSDTTIDGGLIPTTASLRWMSGRTLPVISLSFDGLNNPSELLADLAGLGWDVPPVPPRPSSAIEWVPDPILGTTYTVHPWVVEDFALGRDDWAPADGEQITARTLETLRRHDVGGEFPSGAGAVDHSSSRSTESTLPDAAPHLLLIGSEGDSRPGFASMRAETGGRKRVLTSWAESSAPPATVCPSAEERATFAADAHHAWEVLYAATPVMPVDGQVSVCAAIPGVSADDPKLNKLVAMLGGTVQIAVLIPLDPANGESGALVFGVVPANASELAASTLRLKCNGSIVRTGAAVDR